MRDTDALPGHPAPNLRLPTLDGGTFDLAESAPRAFTVIFFYRGVHCPICKNQLEELNRRIDAFDERGIAVVAISTDPQERATRQNREWTIDRLTVAYGLGEEDARRWGLYISKKEKDGEPERFNEPGMAVVRRDGTVYALYAQSVPFARPRIDDLLKGLDFVIEKDYPARGTLAA